MGLCLGPQNWGSWCPVPLTFAGHRPLKHTSFVDELLCEFGQTVWAYVRGLKNWEPLSSVSLGEGTWKYASSDIGYREEIERSTSNDIGVGQMPENL